MSSATIYDKWETAAYVEPEADLGTVSLEILGNDGAYLELPAEGARDLAMALMRAAASLTWKGESE